MSDNRRPRLGRGDAELVDDLTDRLAGRQLADLPEPRVTARMAAVDLVTALRGGNLDEARIILDKIGDLAAGLVEPESAADRHPIRFEDSEDWASTRVKRSKDREKET
jgi:hypothetical protein